MPGCESFDLRGIKNVAIIGNGNVAIDVVRIMGSSISRLDHTDISSAALEALMHSDVKTIDVIARRGAIQSAMTVKELRPLSKIPEISLRVFDDEIRAGLTENSLLEIDIKSSGESFGTHRARKRLYDLVNSLPREHKPDAKVNINFRFLLSPYKLEKNALCLHKNVLSGPVYKQSANSTGESTQIECDLLFRSIGYKGIHIDPSLPYDPKEGIIVNTDGKVNAKTYVSGWAKTGPYGVIDSTLRSASVSKT